MRGGKGHKLQKSKGRQIKMTPTTYFRNNHFIHFMNIIPDIIYIYK